MPGTDVISRERDKTTSGDSRWMGILIVIIGETGRPLGENVIVFTGVAWF
jgi:hypothetical protein